MRIPTRFAPLLFSAMLSAIMVAIVSGYVLFTTQGMHPDLLAQWGRSCLRTWPIAFPTVFVVAPLVRRAVTRLTAPAVVALLALFAMTPGGAAAQATTATTSRWEFLVSSGTLLPFGGGGVGARSYNYRGLDVDATHNAAAFVNAGGAFDLGRVRLRIEVRDYVSGFASLDGQGATATRNDVVLMAGLRLGTGR